MWALPHVLYQAGVFSASGSKSETAPLPGAQIGVPHYYYCWTCVHTHGQQRSVAQLMSV